MSTDTRSHVFYEQADETLVHAATCWCRGEVCACGPKQYCHLDNCQGVDGQVDRCGMNGCILPNTHIGYCERQALIPCPTIGCQFSCDSLAEMDDHAKAHTEEAS